MEWVYVMCESSSCRYNWKGYCICKNLVIEDTICKSFKPKFAGGMVRRQAFI